MKRAKETEWSKLDNASKIFPATYNERDPKVFRLSCELYEPVEPDLLQVAMERALEDFPLYRSVLRKGLFWYYLESSELRPAAQPESKPVCAPVYVGRKSNLLFRVTYYQCRINLELFHALSDGTGAIWFLQLMVTHYLMLRHGACFSPLKLELHQSAVGRQMDDSFQKHSAAGLFPRSKAPRMPHRIELAYRIRGSRLPENRLRLIEGSMSAQAVLEQAHQYNATLSVFIASLFIYAIIQEMPAHRKKQPVVLSVPINLRSYFDSTSVRNFFSTMNVIYRPEQEDGELDDVIRQVGTCFTNNLTEEQMRRRLNQFMFLERNPVTRIIPLPVKNIILRIAERLANLQVTSAVSNIGRITLPTEVEAFVRQCGVCVSARVPRLALCSCGDRMVMSFTSPFRQTDIQRRFFQLLAQQGIEIEIASNL